MGTLSRHQNIVRPGFCENWKNLTRSSAQSPANVVTHNRAAKLFCHRETNANIVAIIVPEPAHQQKRRRPGLVAMAQFQEIRPFFQRFQRQRGPRRLTACSVRQADNLLRPLARRAASTLRPPVVALRARKPWRRLRLRRLG